MGSFVNIVFIFTLQGALNARFAEGDSIAEMVALQEEFGIFSDGHDLKSSVALLGLAPDAQPHRQKWFEFIDYLKTVPSMNESQSGHDFVRDSLRANLEAEAALPVFFQFHNAADEPRAMVSEAAPLAFSPDVHLVISVPTVDADQAMREGVGRSAPPASRNKTGGKAAKTPAGKAAKKRVAKKTAK